ncbi:MAG: GspE/PulE family protein [Defluviitaleaceae bacterium]|nr:GspE/PulE family protein [Defluviitaleaceae bacterium]
MLKKMRLGDLLIKLNLITTDKLRLAMEYQEKNGIELSEALLQLNSISKNQLIPVLEYQLNSKYIDLSSFDIDKEAVSTVPENIARQYKLIPISRTDDKLQIVMADPLDFIARDDVRLIAGVELEVFLALSNEIERAISLNYTMSEIAEAALEEFEDEIEEPAENVLEEDEDVQRAPIVRLVNSILEQAVRARASDIHIEPFEKSVRVRIRIDGDLREILNVPKSALSPMVARVKILSELDISEKRIPQDGRIEITILKKKVDFRVSILPTVHGEKVVMRILDRSSILVTKAQLGFTEHNLRSFDSLLKSPEGIVLVSGPTGSGKSTTLYAALNEMNRPNSNTVTVEDPVEYRLNGINQVQVNVKAGLTFAGGLRSILRQDPDIIMLGEIRDSETAEIAIRAAITGHLVLSTIHTNDSISTVMRLVDMGVEPFLVTTALLGVVAQRLVKKVCINCKTTRPSTIEENFALKINESVMLAEGRGCNSCNNSGYAGRTAIHEILMLDGELRAMFARGDETESIKERAMKKGLRTLAQSAKELVFEGITTVSEMLRVTYSVDLDV